MVTNILPIILLLSAKMVSSEESYERRYIYLDRDSVCHEGSAMNDMIKLKINIDGLQTRTRYTWGFTTCRENDLRGDSYDLSWPQRWDYYDFDTDTTITFNEEFQAASAYSSLFIKLNTTVQYPSTVDGKPYNCTIVGDGRTQHYGQQQKQYYTPCEYYVKCDKIIKSKEHLVKQH